MRDLLWASTTNLNIGISKTLRSVIRSLPLGEFIIEYFDNDGNVTKVLHFVYTYRRSF